MSFISTLARDLIKRDDVYGLSHISEFYFFGLRETIGAIESVGLVRADELNELQIVEIRNRYLEAVQQAIYDFGTRTYGRNPNGLLVFVFEWPMPEKLASFIRKQTKASIFLRPAVIFSWTVDTQRKLMNLKRWKNGAKKDALKAGEHMADSTVWGKALVGFLEGISDDVG